MRNSSTLEVNFDYQYYQLSNWPWLQIISLNKKKRHEKDDSNKRQIFFLDSTDINECNCHYPYW